MRPMLICDPFTFQAAVTNIFGSRKYGVEDVLEHLFEDDFGLGQRLKRRKESRLPPIAATIAKKTAERTS